MGRVVGGPMLAVFPSFQGNGYHAQTSGARVAEVPKY